MHRDLTDVGIKNGLFSIFIDPARFGDTAAMEDTRATLIDWVKSATPRPGFDEVLIAGEPERRSHTARTKTGIPIDDNSWKTIVEAAKVVNVDITTGAEERRHSAQTVAAGGIDRQRARAEGDFADAVVPVGECADDDRSDVYDEGASTR